MYGLSKLALKFRTFELHDAWLCVSDINVSVSALKRLKAGKYPYEIALGRRFADGWAGIIKVRSNNIQDLIDFLKFCANYL